MSKRLKVVLALVAAALVVAVGWSVHAAVYHHRITVLLRQLRSDDEAVAQAAEDALAGMATRVTVGRLIAEYHAIEDKLEEAWAEVDSSGNLHGEAERYDESSRAPGAALGRIRAILPRIGPPAVGPLINELKGGLPFWQRWRGYEDEGCRCLDSGLQGAAPYILAEIGEAALLPVVEALGSKSQKTAMYAAEALEMMEISDPRANGPLLLLLEHPDDQTREAAARALARSVSPPTDALIALLGHAAAGTRASAAYVLGMLREPKAVVPLADAAEGARSAGEKDVEFAAIIALERIGTEKSRKIVDAFLADGAVVTNIAPWTWPERSLEALAKCEFSKREYSDAERTFLVLSLERFGDPRMARRLAGTDDWMLDQEVRQWAKRKSVLKEVFPDTADQ